MLLVEGQTVVGALALRACDVALRQLIFMRAKIARLARAAEAVLFLILLLAKRLALLDASVVAIGQRLARLLCLLAKVTSLTLAVRAVKLEVILVAPRRAGRLAAGDRAALAAHVDGPAHRMGGLEQRAEEEKFIRALHGSMDRERRALDLTRDAMHVLHKYPQTTHRNPLIFAREVA